VWPCWLEAPSGAGSCCAEGSRVPKMGVVLTRAELVKGLEPVASFTVQDVRGMFEQFEECCPVPALWERAFHELVGRFTPEACAKAFLVLDTDSNGFVDARETLGAFAVLSRGHLSDRMSLLFEVFDLNKEKSIAFDECFLMLRRTMGGLRKMIAIAIPPEKVIHNMTKQVWKSARKHRDTRVSPEEWHTWWSADASIRSALKMVTWQPEDQRGLPTPDQLLNVDYTRGIADAGEDQEVRRAASRYARPQSSQRLLTPRKTSMELADAARQLGELRKSSTLQVPGLPFA